MTIHKYYKPAVVLYEGLKYQCKFMGLQLLNLFDIVINRL